MSLLQNVRYGLRLLGRGPGFTAVAVLSLALGIGANTAIFSVIDALVLRELPVEKPAELVHFGAAQGAGLSNAFPRGDEQLFSPQFYRQIREDRSRLAGVAAMSSIPAEVFARVGRQSDLEPVHCWIVSGNFFPLLGVKAQAGRLIAPEDDLKPGAHPVIVLSDAYWQRRFGRSPAAIGSVMTFAGTAYTVIGVAARGFSGIVVGENADAWIPLAMGPQAQSWIERPEDPSTQFLWLTGRKHPGQTTAQAQTLVGAAYKQWVEQLAGPSPSPERQGEMRQARVTLTEAAHGVSDLRREYTSALGILMGVVGLVLLIACANIANLLLARVSGRRREIAVRLALGAGRARLIAQMLTESTLLALAGGVLGVILAWWGSQALLAMVATGPNPVPLDVTPNLKVLAFTLLIAVLTGLIAGAIPAWRMTRIDAGPALKEGKGAAREAGSGWLGQAIVSAQVALALLLLVGAGLFLRTLVKLQSVPTGFERDRVITVALDTAATGRSGRNLRELAARLERRVGALPGVEAVSFQMLTFGGGRWTGRVWHEGVERSNANAFFADGNMVGQAYHQAMGLRLLAGRVFREAIDTPQSPRVVILNRTLAQRMFPNGQAVGRRVHLQRRVNEVIGVVEDAPVESLREKPPGMFYVFNGQIEDGYRVMVVRAAGPVSPVIPQLRGAIRSEDPGVAIALISTMAELVDRSLNQEKLMARLASFFGAVALLLAAIGLYGVLAYAVSRRTSEIGIRMALGASPASVVRLVLGGSLRLVAAGLILGLLAALAAGRLISSQLYGVSPSDPIAMAGAAALLLTIALVASWIPSRRAALLDPIRALREE